MAYSARTNFASNPNWITYFYAAAYPAPSIFPGPNMGLVSPGFSSRSDTTYRIEPSKTFSLAYGGIATKDRRDAVVTLFNEYPSLTTQPPTDWKPNTCGKGQIDPDSYTDGIIRRLGSKRNVDIYYDSAPTNTYYGLGWYQSKGYIPPSPVPTSRDCLPPMLFKQH